MAADTLALRAVTLSAQLPFFLHSVTCDILTSPRCSPVVAADELFTRGPCLTCD